MIEDYDTELALAITDDEEEQEALVNSLRTARSAPDSLRVVEQQEALGTLNAWYPVAQRQRMKANGDKSDWQFFERYLAGHIDSAKSLLIASMWLGKVEAQLAR